METKQPNSVVLGPDEVVVSRSLLRELIQRLEEKTARERQENSAIVRALAVSIGDVTPVHPVKQVPSRDGRVSKCAELSKRMRID